MIEIKPLAEEYRRCHSCMKSEENARLFELLFGTDRRQNIQVILCEDCLKEFGKKIKTYEDFHPEEKYEGYHPASSIDKKKEHKKEK